MKMTNQFAQNLGKVLKFFLNHIGPEDRLPKSIDGKIYEFDNGLKKTDAYFSGGYVLKNEVLEKERDLANKINERFAHSLFHEVVVDIYMRIKERTSEIRDPLSAYLTESDVDFAKDLLQKMISQSFGKYRVILITDLINWLGTNAFQIGKVKIAKLDEALLHNLPEGDMAKRLFMAKIHQPYATKKDFTENSEKFVSLSTEISGYHYRDEKSYVFDQALSEFRQVFAYLCYVRSYFEHADTGTFKFKIRKPELRGFDKELQWVRNFYVNKKSDIDNLQMIDIIPSNIELSKVAYSIDSETIERINKDCYLREYNELMENTAGNEISGKVRRSLDWLLKAYLEHDITDVIVSLFISLEALMSSDPDPLRGLTDEAAENIAILMTEDPDKRYAFKKQIREAYRLRGKIVHRGESLSESEAISSFRKLERYVILSLRGILSRLDFILKYGKKQKHLQEYFDREKLKGPY